LARRADLAAARTNAYRRRGGPEGELMRLLLSGIAAILVATAGASGPSPGRFADYRFDSGREHVGRIFHYLRSNRDGSLPEHVYVFHKSRSEIEVYKMARRCTNAALVTAELDYDVWSATRFVGGRLGRSGAQEAFATLALDAAARRLDAVVTLPDQELRQTLQLTALPWRLYDFDFAEFTIFSQHLSNYRKDFAVEMALIVTGPNDAQFLKNLGSARAVADGHDRARGVHRYRIEGPAFPGGGRLLLNDEDGYVVEVETGVPNHLEYRDFKFVLQSIDDGGQDAWRRLLLSHFEGCDASRASRPDSESGRSL
jgi:hypothetical protein